MNGNFLFFSQGLLSSFSARSSDEIAALTAAAPTDGASTPNPLLNPPPSSFRANPLPTLVNVTTTADRRPEPRPRSRQGLPGTLSSFMARLTGGRGTSRGSPRGLAVSDGQPLSPTLVSALLERTTSDASETGGQIELPLSPPGESANGYFADGRPVEEGPTGRVGIDGQESVAGGSDGQRSAELLVDRLTRLRAAIAAHRGEGAVGTGQEVTGREVPGKKSTEGGGWGTITLERVESSNGNSREETDCQEKKGCSPDDLV